mgnify:CR=1 FL=1
MSRSPFPIRMAAPGPSRWSARHSTRPGVPHAVRPVSHPPCDSGRTVGVATNANDHAAVPSSSHMVVATLTVFEGQVVFQAERAGLIPAVFLFRLRRGSRQITPGENWP